jgi:hypothetical protein
LALVNELVRRHFGRVRVRSERGAGSTFTIWVPFGRRPGPGRPVRKTRHWPSVGAVAAALAAEAARWDGDEPAGRDGDEPAGRTAIRYRGESRAGCGRSAFLLALNDRLRAVSDPCEIMTVAAQELAGELGIVGVSYHLVDGDEGTMVTAAVYRDGRRSDRCRYAGEPGESGESGPGSVVGYRHRLSDHGEGWDRALRAGEEVFSDDIEADPRQLRVSRTQGRGARSAFAVPLRRNGQLVAVLAGGDPLRRSWSESTRRIVREVALRTWGAVEQALVERPR